jgi:hypothetical protein
MEVEFQPVDPGVALIAVDRVFGHTFYLSISD